MRKLFFAIAVAPGVALAGGLPDLSKLDLAPAPSRQLPVKRDSATNTCAAYGPGFVKAAGSDTCVKLSGAARVDAIGSR
jgi:hypothetical protein